MNNKKPLRELKTLYSESRRLEEARENEIGGIEKNTTLCRRGSTEFRSKVSHEAVQRSDPKYKAPLLDKTKKWVGKGPLSDSVVKNIIKNTITKLDIADSVDHCQDVLNHIRVG